MKIVRLTTSLDFGGVEKRIEISAKEFNKRPDIDLYVVAIGKGGTISQSLEQSGVKTILLDQQYRIPSIGAIFKLYQLFKTIKPDVLHTSGAEANFHGLIAGWLAGVKTRIGEEIGYPNHNILWRKVFNFTYRFSHKVIGISKAVVDKIVALGEVNLHKTQVVYNPVELPFYGLPAEKTPGNVFVFITVSRLVSVKNLENLIRAFHMVCQSTERSLQLHVVGNGPELTKLQQLSKALGIAEKVLFLGFQEKVTPFLLKADAFILASFSEGFSIALVEAMLAERISLATKVGGPSEIIRDNITGMLIDPYSNEDMKAHMLQAVKMSEQERKAMAMKAKVDVMQRFTPTIYVDHLLSLYQECQK